MSNKNKINGKDLIKNPKLTIIIPSYNEEENILRIYEQIKENIKDIPLELIYVDDGSTDRSIDKFKKLQKTNDGIDIKVIRFSRNFGKESGMYAGLNEVSDDSEFIAIVDGDLQQDSIYIKQMYDKLKNDENYDVVACYQEDRKEGGVLSFFKKVFYGIINKNSQTTFVNGASDFRVFRRNVLEAILNMPEHNRFSKGIFSWIGFNTYFMPYEVKEREFGKTKWSFISLSKYATLGFRQFTDVFVKIINTIPILLFIAAILYLIIKGVISGLDKLDMLISLSFFLSSIILFVQSEILKHINLIKDDTRNRPQYIIKEILTNYK